MFSLKRLALLFVGLLFVGVLIAPAQDPGTAPVNFSDMAQKVVVEFQGDKQTYEARFRTIRLQTTNGLVELKISRIATLSVEHVERGAPRAYAELVDHTRLQGELISTEFAMAAGAETKLLSPKDFHRLTFPHPKNTGLVAVLIGLLTLTFMEIVLGIDNIIFIAIVAAKLPEEQQPKARRIGLAAALVTRLMLLTSLSFLLSLTKPVFTLPELPFLEDPEARGVSWRDLILLVGGLFLIGKSTMEIREKVEHSQHSETAKPKVKAKFGAVIIQIAILDIIFSLDSVITAVGMVDELWIMVTAVIVAVVAMIIFAEPISRFVDRNPTIKILALSFLILIGVLLVAESLGQHLDKGYIYFAMAFSVVVEIINMRLRRVPVVPQPRPEFVE
jgi:predicted tellurium resistance membrane protein TerC